MNKTQLKRVKELSKPYYGKTGKYHDWEHIRRVEKLCLRLSKGFKIVDTNILLASCYLHDVGRTKSDKLHVQAGINIAKRLLTKIAVPPGDIVKVEHVIFSHDLANIRNAQTVEAKILFDADKLEIGTVSGFLRTVYWLTNERNMNLNDAVDYYWVNLSENWEILVQTLDARKIIRKQIPIIKNFVVGFQEWEKNFK